MIFGCACNTAPYLSPCNFISGQSFQRYYKPSLNWRVRMNRFKLKCNDVKQNRIIAAMRSQRAISVPENRLIDLFFGKIYRGRTISYSIFTPTEKINQEKTNRTIYCLKLAASWNCTLGWEFSIKSECSYPSVLRKTSQIRFSNTDIITCWKITNLWKFETVNLLFCISFGSKTR